MTVELGCEVYLVRHGETESNRALKIQGQSDSPLTEEGIDQAHSLGKRLGDLSFAKLISSPLERAHHSARILGSYLNRSVELDDRVQEISFGEVEGLTWARVHEKYPDLAEKWRQHHNEVALPGGESRHEVVTRAKQLLQEVALSHLGKKVLIVTHGGVLAAIFAHILGIPSGTRPRCVIGNTSLHILRFKQDEWKIKTWGDTSHL